MTELTDREREAIKIFRALGDPTRFRIVRMLLRAGELGCADFQAAFPLSAPALSHHFRILQDCGLLAVRKEGPFHYYSLRQEQLERFLPSFAQAANGDDPVSP
jgi:DNA-binding transcriptional ArsR family regulator